MINLIQDLKHNRKDPIIMSVLATYRFGNWVYYRVKLPVLRHLMWFLYHILDVIFVRVIGHGELHAQAKIGPRLRLPHGINGTIVAPESIIGCDVTIFHQVTIGGRNNLGYPTIGNKAFIGVGAKILGLVHVGNSAQIGANSVVIHDVPENCTAIGIPAHIKK